MAGTLSGGQQQQLAIGRVLVGGPALILLDEPSEGVQPSIVQLICRVLRAIRDDLGTTILFVEQNMDTILTMAERGYVMEKGHVVARLEGGDSLAGKCPTPPAAIEDQLWWGGKRDVGAGEQSGPRPRRGGRGRHVHRSCAGRHARRRAARCRAQGAEHA